VKYIKLTFENIDHFTTAKIECSGLKNRILQFF
jgi:hypothetical protein